MLNNGHTLQANVLGRRVRDIAMDEGTPRLTDGKTYGNTLARVLLDYLTDRAPEGPRLTMDEIDLGSFYKAEQICKRPIPLPPEYRNP